MAALADQADVEARLRRDLTADEVEWLPGVLDEASALVSAYCGDRAFEPVPDRVRIVTSRVAARALTGRTDSATAITNAAHVFSQTVTLNADAANGGVWLTKADKLALHRWAVSGKAFSVDISGR
ncbi:hypothetical protein [Mycobacteroides abscessus]|uniref:hypothetical protein n=1 Tax=Mycobacteroides abscessus TaxID=36809 RepID=UPI00210330D7|nr:hypothetical protein [Mycobacteroides abscessus]